MIFNFKQKSFLASFLLGCAQSMMMPMTVSDETDLAALLAASFRERMLYSSYMIINMFRRSITLNFNIKFKREITAYLI